MSIQRLEEYNIYLILRFQFTLIFSKQCSRISITSSHAKRFNYFLLCIFSTYSGGLGLSRAYCTTAYLICFPNNFYLSILRMFVFIIKNLCCQGKNITHDTLSERGQFPKSLYFQLRMVVKIVDWKPMRPLWQTIFQTSRNLTDADSAAVERQLRIESAR